MQAYAVSYSKYLIAACMVLYTLLAYVALPSGTEVRRTCESLQRLCIGVFTVNAYLDRRQSWPKNEDYFTFGLMQLVIVLGTALLYRKLYTGIRICSCSTIFS